MKKILSVAALMLFSLTALAQAGTGSWTLMPKLGFGWAKLAGDDIYYSAGEKLESRHRLGLVAGVEAEGRLGRQSGLSVGLLYSQQGQNYADTGDFRNFHTRLDYLNLPVLEHLYLTDRLAVLAGIQLSFLLHKSTTVEERSLSRVGATGTAQWEKMSYETDIRAFDFGIPIGITYDPVDFLRLDLRYNIGLYNVAKFSDYLKYHNRVVQLTVGYRFQL